MVAWKKPWSVGKLAGVDEDGQEIKGGLLQDVSLLSICYDDLRLMVSEATAMPVRWVGDRISGTRSTLPHRWLIKLPLKADDLIPKDVVGRISQQTCVGVSKNDPIHKIWPSSNVSPGIKGIMGFLRPMIYYYGDEACSVCRANTEETGGWKEGLGKRELGGYAAGLAMPCA